MKKQIGNNLARLVRQLRRDEGSVRDARGLHIAYRCPAGRLTIGYGHNLDARPLPDITPTSALTEGQALRILEQDASETGCAVLQALPWTASLDFPRFAVLVNMAFNMGVRGLLGFSATLEAIRQGEYARAARHMAASRWARQVGGRARRLCGQMETGEWL